MENFIILFVLIFGLGTCLAYLFISFKDLGMGKEEIVYRVLSVLGIIICSSFLIKLYIL